MKKTMLILGIPIVILIIMCFLLYVIIWPGLFKNSPNLSKKENKAVKELIIDTIKDRCSSLYNFEKIELYDESFSENIIQFDPEAGIKKKCICIIDLDFMLSIEKEDYGIYNVIIKSHYPENCYYHITIKNNNGKYSVISFLVDI